MNGEEDKYNFPETMNQQDRYFGLPVDELIVTAPLLILGVLNNLSVELGVIAGILWFIVRYLK
ncbi:type IV conjugative transfer system protein TraL, partial [Enterobacter hormaechei]